MDEHKIITGMLLVALVVSVAGSMLVVDRMSGLGQNGISGAATGTSDLNITQDITITLPDSTINFGAGKVDSDQDYAWINSLTGSVTGGSWANQSDNITIRNDGNVGVNVTISFDKHSGKNETSFICSGDPGNCGEGLTHTGVNGPLAFGYKADEIEAGSCASGLKSQKTDVVKENQNYNVCGCLRSTSAEDEVSISMQVGIPADASGNKESTITFTSTASGVSC